jgi:hypothetical protein
MAITLKGTAEILELEMHSLITSPTVIVVMALYSCRVTLRVSSERRPVRLHTSEELYLFGRIPAPELTALLRSN